MRPPHISKTDSQVAQGMSRHTISFTDQAEEKMLRAEGGMAKPPRLFLCQPEHRPSPLRELLKIISHRGLHRPQWNQVYYRP